MKSFPKKMLSLVLTLVVAAGLCGAASADCSPEFRLVPAGLVFTPPEEMQSVQGVIVTDGARPVSYENDVFYAYFIYCPMAQADFDAVLAESGPSALSDKLTFLFYVFAVGEGEDLSALQLLSFSVDPALLTEIGSENGYTYYLYSDLTAEKLPELESPYAEELSALVGMKDRIAAGFSFIPPLNLFTDLVGRTLSFETTDIDGNPVSSADLFAQHEITMLNVWATWCHWCIVEFPELQTISVSLADRGAAVVGLLSDTEMVEDAKQLVQENGVTYPIILAPDSLENYLPIIGYPTTFFIGRDGTFLCPPVIGADVPQYKTVLESLLAPAE